MTDSNNTAIATESTDQDTILAAVDLGSNSFHMKVARVNQGHVQVIDRLREMVRLGAGLDKKGRLSDEAKQRALACLQRFGERLRGVAAENVRVVGTNTLRKARKCKDFISQAETALGHAVEVISGIEEARLIYLGVSHSLPEAQGRRLVLDIGGGSTELIIGEGFESLHLESLYMGCVNMSELYFSKGRIDKERWQRALLHAQMELEPHTTGFRRMGWAEAVGASGTARAVAKVLEAQSWSSGGITRKGLKKLRKALLDAGHIDKIELSGLASERRPVFAGGLVILEAVFDALQIEHMITADGALREGLLYDLMGRLEHEDVRARSVDKLALQYHVDEAHATRVRQTALDLFELVKQDWGLSKRYAAPLAWAAQLHEIGLAVAHSGYHKHGAYLIRYGDMMGFSESDKLLLAAIVRNHRRKFDSQIVGELEPKVQDISVKLAILLRISSILHRGRSETPLPELVLRVHEKQLTLGMPEGWLAEHALSRADLEAESRYLAPLGYSLDVKEYL